MKISLMETHCVAKFFLQVLLHMLFHEPFVLVTAEKNNSMFVFTKREDNKVFECYPVSWNAMNSSTKHFQKEHL